MKKVLRGALAGFGQVAEKAHLPGFAAAGGFEIIAVAEAQPQRAEAAKAALPEARLYSSLEELLAVEEGLDFVDIATPPFLHGEQTLAALNAGLHVLCEKPLSLDLDQLAGIFSAADAADRAVFTVHNWAYSPQWRKTFELARAAGPVSHVHLSTLRLQPAAGALPGDWRRDGAKAGGGILVDHGWHNLYLLYRLVASHPSRLTACLDEQTPARVEDAATVFFEFPGATAALHLSWRAGLRYNGAVIHAQDATVELRDDAVILRKDGAEPKSFSFPQRLSAGSAHPDWFAAMLPDFAAAVADPARRAANRREADFCLKMIRRVYHSVRVGRNPLRPSLGLR